MGDVKSDLHGNAPDTCPVALLLVDVINPMDFPEAERLLKRALPAAEQLASLKQKAKAAGVPVIFANDNFGRWRSDFHAVVKRCLEPGSKSKQLVELLRPEAEDYFVLKPKHSAFFSTTLDTLLRYLGTQTVVLGGFATDICILFTANDVYMRDLRLIIPPEGVAANEERDHKAALDLMSRVLKAATPPASEIDFISLAKPTRQRG